MKKSLLATAVSTAMISAGAYATPSTVELDIGTGSIVIACPSTPTPVPPDPAWVGGAFTVANPSNVTMNGELCLDLSPNVPSTVALDFINVAGPLVGSVGTVFSSGTINIWTDWGGSTGWLYYGAIDASVDPIACLISGGIGGITAGPAFTGGLMPTGTPACSANLLGMPADIYMN